MSSRAAYESHANRLRWGSQRHLLLKAYGATRRKVGMTDEEVAKMVGLYRPGVMFWSRCAELRGAGLIEEVKQVKSSQGNLVQSCRITEAGREMLAGMRAERRAA